MEKYSDFKAASLLRGLFFYPQKVFMLYYTQFFPSRFLVEKKELPLKKSRIRLTNEFPWLYKNPFRINSQKVEKFE